MCQRVTCPTCQKPDWRGCGAHIEQVLGNVPKGDRCKCRETTSAGGERPSSLLGRFFGR